jgi:hypothetical protein
LNKATIKSRHYLACSAALFTLIIPSLAVAQAAAPAITRAMLVGMYNGGQMEVGAQLLLKADGHFGYELATVRSTKARRAPGNSKMALSF